MMGEPRSRAHLRRRMKRRLSMRLRVARCRCSNGRSWIRFPTTQGILKRAVSAAATMLRVETLVCT